MGSALAIPILLGVGAVLVPLGTAMWRKPQFGVLVLAALLPYDGLLLLLDPPALVNGWKEILTLCVFVAAVAHTRPGRRGRPPGFWWPTAALLGLGILWLAFRPTLATLLGVKVAFFFLLLPVVLWLQPLDSRDRDRLVTIMMVNGAITAVVGLAQQVVGPETLNAIGYDYNSEIRFAGGILRSFSTFVQPFPFAFFVMVVVLIGIPIALTDRQRRRNRLFLASTPVLLVGMGSAVVRGAFLGLVAGGLYLMATRYRVLGHAVLVGFIGLLFLPGSVLASLGSSTSLGQRTTGWATEVVDEGVEPFGVGIGTVGAAAEVVEDSADRGDRTFPSEGGERYQPDNYYVKTLIEFGPLGLWLLVWSVGSAISFGGRISRRRLAAGPDDEALAVGITAATIAAAAAGSVAAYWEIFPVDAFYWLFLGVLPSLAASSSTGTHSAREEVASRPTVSNSSTGSLASA